jgi:hypothetical protein
MVHLGICGIFSPDALGIPKAVLSAFFVAHQSATTKNFPPPKPL